MPFLNINTIKAMRQDLRALFPTANGWKWSVTTLENNTGVSVALMQYPGCYKFPQNASIDHHNPKESCEKIGLGSEEIKIMKQACTILMLGWKYDDSPTHANYFPILRIGKWGKPAVSS